MISAPLRVRRSARSGRARNFVSSPKSACGAQVFPSSLLTSACRSETATTLPSGRFAYGPMWGLASLCVFG